MESFAYVNHNGIDPQNVFAPFGENGQDGYCKHVFNVVGKTHVVLHVHKAHQS